MIRLALFITLLVSFLQKVDSQIFQSDYSTRNDSLVPEHKILLDLQGSTWFYNNEYFNPYYEGYSLIGGNFQPQLVFRSNSKLRLSVGAHLQRFYGNNITTLAKPVFSITYKPFQNFSVLMGSFNGGENHGMNDVMFSFENHLTNIQENGILINYSNSRVSSETWLNWESFIVPGDTVQEQFTAGTSNRIEIIELGNWNVSVPLVFLAHHAGGQINISDKPVETLINISEGVRITKGFQQSSGNNIFAEATVFHSMGDFTPSSGMGLSLKSGVQLAHFELQGEYFKGNDFVSFTGNSLYRSYENSGNPLIPFKYGGNQELLNFKAGYRQKIGKSSFLFLRFEGYHFAGSNKLDYSYSVHFQVRDFIKLL